MSQEDMITLAQMDKALNGDGNAYKLLMDSCYGAPVQQIEQTNTERPIFKEIDLDCLMEDDGVSKDNSAEQDSQAKEEG